LMLLRWTPVDGAVIAIRQLTFVSLWTAKALSIEFKLKSSRAL